MLSATSELWFLCTYYLLTPIINNCRICLTSRSPHKVNLSEGVFQPTAAERFSLNDYGLEHKPLTTSELSLTTSTENESLRRRLDCLLLFGCVLYEAMNYMHLVSACLWPKHCNLSKSVRQTKGRLYLLSGAPFPQIFQGPVSYGAVNLVCKPHSKDKFRRD